MQSSLQAECLAVAVRTADELLALAKQDHCGVYWDSIPRGSSTAANAAMELSLHDGTSGILLFLTELERRRPDAQWRELIGRVVAWLRAKSRTAPVRPGFYCGFPGAMVALAMAEKLLGLEPSAGSPDAWRSLLQAERTSPGSLSDGVAGTLLGLEVLCDLGVSDTPAELAPELLRLLVSQTRLTGDGAYWGRHPASIGPCVSFCHGSPGVEYLLSRYRGDDAAAADWMADAGMKQENAQFDAVRGNWPDFMNEEHFDAPEVRKRLFKAAEREEKSDFRLVGDSIGWGNGAAGVLLARSSWARTGDMVRASERIARGCAAAAGSGAVDFSLYRGWAGVGLAVKHCGADDLPALHGLTGSLAARCIEHHRQHGTFKPARDGSASHLALMTGGVGPAYFLLLAGDELAVASVIAPLGAPPAGRPCPVTRTEATRIIATASQPRTMAALSEPAVAALTPPIELTLDGLLERVEACTYQDPGAHGGAWAFETAVLRAEAEQDCYNFLTWRRAITIKQANAERRFTNDRNLLRQTVRLRADVQLGRIRGLVPATAADPKSDASLVLLVPEFFGIVKHDVAPGSYAILSQLKRPMRVKELCDVVGTKYPSLAGPDGVEPVVLQEVRAAFAVGALRIDRRAPLQEFFWALLRC
jgi:hypothetical protein